MSVIKSIIVMIPWLCLSGCILPYYGTRKINPPNSNIRIIDSDSGEEISDAIIISRFDTKECVYLNDARYHKSDTAINVVEKKHWYVMVFPLAMLGPFEELDGFVVCSKGYDVAYYSRFFVAAPIVLHKATSPKTTERLIADLQCLIIRHEKTLEGGRLYGVTNSVDVENRLAPKDIQLIRNYLDK